jgi:hypothetical protein
MLQMMQSDVLASVLHHSCIHSNVASASVDVVSHVHDNDAQLRFPYPAVISSTYSHVPSNVHRDVLALSAVQIIQRSSLIQSVVLDGTQGTCSNRPRWVDQVRMTRRDRT